MAINRPTTKTVISTTAWGVPMTDQVNLLSNTRVVAGKYVNPTLSNVANSTKTAIPGVAITFAAVATHNYRVHAGVTLGCSTAGAWLYGGIEGGGIGGNEIFSSWGASTVLPAWGTNIPIMGFVGPTAGRLNFPNGNVTLQLYGNCNGGAGTTWQVAGWCYIACEDLGPF